MWRRALPTHHVKSQRLPCASRRHSFGAYSLFLLLLLHVHNAHTKRSFSLWLRKGNDLQVKLGLDPTLPLYLVRDGYEVRWYKGWGSPWSFSEFSPIRYTESFYEFRWIAKSKRVFYRIRLHSLTPRLMAAPRLDGAPAMGVVPATKTPQSFRIYFPCYKNATGTVGRFMVRFEFFRGRRRRKPLFVTGPIALALNRQCPPATQHYRGIHRQDVPSECTAGWGLQKRGGSDFRRLTCRSNYIVRGKLKSVPDGSRQQFLQVTKQYRHLKKGSTDQKLRGEVGVEISSELADCPNWQHIRVNNEYLFFMRMANGRAHFDEKSVIALFNKKAKRVLKRIRRFELTCLPDIKLS